MEGCGQGSDAITLHDLHSLGIYVPIQQSLNGRNREFKISSSLFFLIVTGTLVISLLGRYHYQEYRQYQPTHHLRAHGRPQEFHRCLPIRHLETVVPHRRPALVRSSRPRRLQDY